MLEDMVNAGATVVHIDSQVNSRWKGHLDMQVRHMKGNLSFMTNSSKIAKIIEDWSWNGDRHYAPKCVEDIEHDVTFENVVKQMHMEAEGEYLIKLTFPTAFAAEEEEERVEKETY